MFEEYLECDILKYWKNGNSGFKGKHFKCSFQDLSAPQVASVPMCFLQNTIFQVDIFSHILYLNINRQMISGLIIKMIIYLL